MESCAHHPEAKAQFICEWCNSALCQNCVKEVRTFHHAMHTCACGGRAVPMQAPQEEITSQRTEFVPANHLLKSGWPLFIGLVIP